MKFLFIGFVIGTCLGLSIAPKSGTVQALRPVVNVRIQAHTMANYCTNGEMVYIDTEWEKVKP